MRRAGVRNPEVAGSVGNQGDGYWIEYDLPGGGCLALMNFGTDKPSASAGGTVALEVDDLDDVMQDVKEKGVPRVLVAVSSRRRTPVHAAPG